MKIVRFYFLGVTLLIFSSPSIGQIDKNFRENQKKAFSASSTDECQSSLKFCNDVLKLVPTHHVINYLSARLNAILGNDDIAIEQLKKAAKLGYTPISSQNKIHYLNDPAFNKLREKESFKSIVEILQNCEQPIHKSEVAFTLNEKDIMPEGICYDQAEKMFYFGSETKNKIIKIDHFGKSFDFTLEKQDGLGSLRGIHIDSTHRILWVCSELRDTTGIFKYNLSTGKLIRKYLLARGDIRTSFNDLVIHPNGDVYITDVGSSAIYLISHTTDELEVFLKNENILSPNGITLSDDGKTIYIGDTPIGIFKIDIRTKSSYLLSHSADFSSDDIDGLYFVNNNLYAIQPGLNTISRFELNNDASYIKSQEIFERNTAYLDWPTTGVIVDDYFYFIADTQGKGNKLEGVIIMKAHLK